MQKFCTKVFLFVTMSQNTRPYSNHVFPRIMHRIFKVEVSRMFWVILFLEILHCIYLEDGYDVLCQKTPKSIKYKEFSVLCLTFILFCLKMHGCLYLDDKTFSQVTKSTHQKRILAITNANG